MYTGPHTITNGLVFAAEPTSPRSYPKTGTVWKDLSQIHHNTSIPSGAWTNSYNGYMNYTSDQTSITSPSEWRGTDELTIEMWYRPATNGVYTGCCDTIFGRYDFRFFQINASLYTMISFDNGGRYYQHPAFTVAYDQWHHIVGARRDNRFIIWANGVEIHNSTFGTGLPLYNVTSTWYISTTRQSNVDFGSLRIYNRGLTDSEILQNFNARKNLYI
tara:strand:+ start:1421 stop:2071 length:651 start_codon:yes stop_codon:yes gene_type:complete